MISGLDLETRVQFLDSNYSSYSVLKDPLIKSNFSHLWEAELKNYGLDTRSYNASCDVVKEILHGQRYVVTTGQQAMLAGGPLLVLYKAYSALKHAQEISNKIKQKTAVVFWIAGDDSDWDEVNHFEHLKSQSIFKFNHVQRQDGQTITSTSLTQKDKDQWLAWLRRSHRSDLQEQILEMENYFQEGDTLVISLGRWLKSIFPQADFLVIDGGGDAVRTTENKVIGKVLQENSLLQDTLSRQAEFLKEKSIRLQVPLDEKKPRCFVLKNNLRHRHYVHDHFDDCELVHDALSRPILVESIFPVIGHVLGPAELKYFALLQGSFEIFGMRSPLINKRLNATLLRVQDRSLIDLSGMECSHLASAHHHVISNALFNLKYQELRESLKSKSFKFPDLTDLAKHGLSVDAQKEIEARAEKKLEFEWEKVIKRIQKSVLQQDQDLQDRSRDTADWLGNGRLQERNLSFWEAESQLPGIVRSLTKWDATSEVHQYGDFYE